jgi:hypothetical protein
MMFDALTLLLFLSSTSLIQARLRPRQAASLNGTTTTSGGGGAAVGRILQLRWINADANAPESKYDPLPPMALIDANSMSMSTNWNMEAVTIGNVGSIVWDFGGKKRTEETAPWSLCGNRGKDFFACKQLAIGTRYTNVTATAYSSKGGTGTKLSSVSIQLAISAMSLSLIDSKTDQDLGQLNPGTTLYRSQRPAINFRANVDAFVNVGSVQFTWNGKVFRTDSFAPFSFNGNQGLDFFDWVPPLGSHRIKATAFQDKNAQGDALLSVEVSFMVQESMPAPSTTSRPVQPPMTPPASRPSRRPVIPPVPAPLSAAPVPAPSIAFDLVPPRLVNFTLLSSSLVNLTSGAPAVTSMKIVAQDDGSGFGDDSIRAIRSVLGQGITYILSPYTTSGATSGTPVVRNASVTFPPFVANGNYQLEVALSDYNRNMATFNTDELARRKLPSQINVIGSPYLSVLQAFAPISPTTIDVSNGARAVSFVTSLAGVLKSVDLRLEVTPGSNDFVLFPDKDIAFSGQQQVFFTGNIPQGTKSGKYLLRLVVVRDDRTVDEINAVDFAARNYPSFITIVELGAPVARTTPAPLPVPLSAAPVPAPTTAFDLVPPRLVNFTLLSSSLVNLTSGVPVVTSMQIVAQDDGSGFGDDSIRAIRSVLGQGITYILSPYTTSGATSGTPVVRNASLTFPPFVANGNYQLEVTLSDYNRNIATFKADELARRKLPSQINVIGSPFLSVLQAFAPISPTTIDVSNGARTVSFVTSLAGVIKSVDLRLEVTPGSNDFVLFPDRPIAFSGQQQVFFTGNIPQGTKSGKYLLRLVVVRDDRTVDEINAVDFTARNYPSFITIIEPGAPMPRTTPAPLRAPTPQPVQPPTTVTRP